MFNAIKKMKVNVEDENYKINCDFEGFKHSFKHRDSLIYHFKNHFKCELTCKNVGRYLDIKMI